MENLLKVVLLMGAFCFPLVSCGGGGTQPGANTSQTAEQGYHLVQFDTDGGSEIPSQKVKHGEKIEKPSDPVKEGCSFQGWTYKGEEWSFLGYVVTEDMTLKARYSVKQFWVTLVDQVQAGGWFYCTNQNLADSLKYGTTVTLRAMPMKGNTLAGWYNGEEFLSDDPDYSFAVKNTMNIKAKWKKGTTGYGINVEQREHGTITIDKTRANNGDVVTGKATPQKGYKTTGVSLVKYTFENGKLVLSWDKSLCSRDHDIWIGFDSGHWGDVFLYAWNDKGQANKDWPGIKLQSFEINFEKLNKGRTGNDKFTRFIISDEKYQTGDLLIKDYEEYQDITIKKATKADQSVYYEAVPENKVDILNEDGTFSFPISQSCCITAGFVEI